MALYFESVHSDHPVQIRIISGVPNSPSSSAKHQYTLFYFFNLLLIHSLAIGHFSERKTRTSRSDKSESHIVEWYNYACPVIVEYQVALLLTPLECTGNNKPWFQAMPSTSIESDVLLIESCCGAVYAAAALTSYGLKLHVLESGISSYPRGHGMISMSKRLPSIVISKLGRCSSEE